MYIDRPRTFAPSRASFAEGHNVRVLREITALPRELVLEQIFIASSEFTTTTRSRRQKHFYCWRNVSRWTDCGWQPSRISARCPGLYLALSHTYSSNILCLISVVLNRLPERLSNNNNKSSSSRANNPKCHTLMRHDELPGSPDNEGGLRKGAVGLSQCSRNPIGLDRENKKMEKVPTFKK